MPNWMYLAAGAVDKNITITASGAYDNETPTETATLEATHVSAQEVIAELAKARAVATSYSYTSANGTTVTGYIKSVTYKEEEGGGLFDLTISLGVVVANPTIAWRYVGSGGAEKNLVVAKSMKQSDATVYPANRIYSYEGAEETVSITAKGLTKANYDNEKAKVTGNAATYTYTMNNNDTFSGIPKGITFKQEEKTGLYEVTINLIK